MAPTPEEFQAWRDNPVSRWVFMAIQQGCDLQRDEWMRQSWAEGKADPLALNELRTRADAYSAILETGYEAYCDLTGDDPRTD